MKPKPFQNRAHMEPRGGQDNIKKEKYPKTEKVANCFKRDAKTSKIYPTNPPQIGRLKPLFCRLGLRFGRFLEVAGLHYETVLVVWADSGCQARLGRRVRWPLVDVTN